VWLRRLLKELGYNQEQPTIIYEDNKGCIDLSKNPVHHKRTKHIDIQYHYVRERVESREVQLVQCASEKNIADIFTKALTKDKFQRLKKELFSNV
jgi:hypothetical protein